MRLLVLLLVATSASVESFVVGTKGGLVHPTRAVDEDEVWLQQREALRPLLESLRVGQWKYRRADENPVVIAEGIPDDMVDIFVDAREGKGCAIEFEQTDKGWTALLVKMEGYAPKVCGEIEAGYQCSRYADDIRPDNEDDPELSVGGGLVSVGEDGRRVNPDLSMRVAGGQKARFIFEIDHLSNDSPKAQAKRVGQLFRSIGATLRNVVTIKFHDRKKNGRFPAICVVYHRDDNDNIHVVRAFDVGTTAYHNIDDDMRDAWNDMILDPGFTLETYDVPPDDFFRPRQCPENLRDYFQVAIPQNDLFYDEPTYRPPPDPRPLLLDIYKIMRRIDDELWDHDVGPLPPPIEALGY